jgi:hypothetical protein
MNRLDTITAYLSMLAALLMAFAPLLQDTAPGSDRSIVVAVAGVLTAVIVLVRILAARGQTSLLLQEIHAVREEVLVVDRRLRLLSDSGGRGTRTKNC